MEFKRQRKLVIQYFELLLRHSLHIMAEMLTIVQIQIHVFTPRMLDSMKKFFNDRILAISLMTFPMMIKAEVFEEFAVGEHAVVFDLVHVQLVSYQHNTIMVQSLLHYN